MALSELAVTDWRFTHRGNLLMNICGPLSWSQALKQNRCLCAVHVAFAPLDSIFFSCLYYFVGVFFCCFFWGSFKLDVLNPLRWFKTVVLLHCVFLEDIYVSIPQPLWNPVCEECVVPLSSLQVLLSEAEDLQMLLKSVAARLRSLWNRFHSLLKTVWWWWGGEACTENLPVAKATGPSHLSSKWPGSQCALLF